MTSDPGHIVGENMHRLRIAAGESQLEAAQRLQQHGLDWTRDHVASLENGRRSTVTVDEIVILSWAYAVTLDEWFAGSGDVRLSKTMSADRSDLRDALRGKRKDVSPRVIDFSNVADLEADGRVAERLGVDQETVMRAAHAMWGRTLTDERNRRLADKQKDPQAMRTLRGGMTKRLMREVEAHLKEER